MNEALQPVNPYDVSKMKIIPQNDVDAAFMEDLKDAISDRNATLDEVIALINTTAAQSWITHDQIDFAEYLTDTIEALKS